jgi:hypothetical protein
MFHALFFAATVASAPCSAAADHQFDFWVGNWTVTAKDGKPAGKDLVTRDYNGCVIIEHWRGAHGTNGEALNTYLPDSQQWQQSWADNTGLTLHLVGKLEGNTMVLSEKHVANGKTTIDRVKWIPLPDGRVREYWQSSSDGVHWQDVFDGYFSKVK